MWLCSLVVWREWIFYLRNCNCSIVLQLFVSVTFSKRLAGFTLVQQPVTMNPSWYSPLIKCKIGLVVPLVPFANLSLSSLFQSRQSLNYSTQSASLHHFTICDFQNFWCNLWASMYLQCDKKSFLKETAILFLWAKLKNKKKIMGSMLFISNMIAVVLWKSHKINLLWSSLTLY